MAKRIRSKLSYANVVATLALLVAISGGATAIAISAGKNTVTTKSIKPGNVTAQDLAPIKTVVEQMTLTGGPPIIRLFCPPKSRPLSGGGVGGAGVQASYPTPGGWQVNFEGSAGQSAVGYVLCLTGGPGKPRNEF